MEKKMETTIVYWGYTGIMEKKMETTIVLSVLHEMSRLVLPASHVPICFSWLSPVMPTQRSFIALPVIPQESEVLGVERDARQVQIKKVSRQAKLKHPRKS